MPRLICLGLLFLLPQISWAKKPVRVVSSDQIVAELKKRGPKNLLGRRCASLDGLDVWGGLRTTSAKAVEGTGLKVRCNSEGVVKHVVLRPAFEGTLPRGTTWDFSQARVMAKLTSAGVEDLARSDTDDNGPLVVLPGRVITTWRWSDGSNGPERIVLTKGAPPVPDSKTVNWSGRKVTYTGTKLNGKSRTVLAAAPGQKVKLQSRWSLRTDGGDLYCPTCIVQFYVGLQGELGQCITSRVMVPGSSGSGKAKVKFQAPTRPGVYRITQMQSTDYSCIDVRHDGKDAKAIGTIVVQ